MIGPSELKEELLLSEERINRPRISKKNPDGTIEISDGCDRYSKCLDKADEKNWASFTCIKCQKFKEVKWEN